MTSSKPLNTLLVAAERDRGGLRQPSPPSASQEVEDAFTAAATEYLKANIREVVTRAGGGDIQYQNHQPFSVLLYSHRERGHMRIEEAMALGLLR